MVLWFVQRQVVSCLQVKPELRWRVERPGKKPGRIWWHPSLTTDNLIDSNAVETREITFQCFQTIAWRRFQIFQRRDSIENIQFVQGHIFYPNRYFSWATTWNTVIKIWCCPISKSNYHEQKLIDSRYPCKRISGRTCDSRKNPEVCCWRAIAMTIHKKAGSPGQVAWATLTNPDSGLVRLHWDDSRANCHGQLPLVYWVSSQRSAVLTQSSRALVERTSWKSFWEYSLQQLACPWKPFGSLVKGDGTWYTKSSFHRSMALDYECIIDLEME